MKRRGWIVAAIAAAAFAACVAHFHRNPPRSDMERARRHGMVKLARSVAGRVAMDFAKSRQGVGPSSLEEFAAFARGRMENPFHDTAEAAIEARGTVLLLSFPCSRLQGLGETTLVLEHRFEAEPEPSRIYFEIRERGIVSWR